MNLNLIEERTVALAGVLQACKQVRALARSGESDDLDTVPSMQSILVLDAINTPAVFGGIDGIRSGLMMVSEGILSSPQAGNIEILRYAMALLHLQNQLYRDEQKFNDFGEAVGRLSAYSSDQFIDACSEVYQTHISGMRPQIIVQGEQGYLQREDVPPRIRGLLLAGLRSSVLWRQKGGSRFKLLWERTRMQNAAKKILKMGLAH